MTFKLIFIILLFSVIILPNEGEFVWQENKKLTWEDFQAKPDKYSDAVALTASGITFGYSYRQQRGNGQIVSFTAEVNAFFYPKQSWFNEERANAYILQHEQLHFDLTELYVRKFRQAVQNLKVTKTIKSDLKTLQNKINKALSEAQNQYDFETNHSINKEVQLKWVDSIQTELIKLNAFKSI